ncbi:VOC family protein [Streptomyces sp. 8L]|uniref:VOC family protein n=1 Tax=Streptomyces sp. 8L TaxID=2877242 RepID=UPI001CD45ED3|nr:VOC family protein [Streptomyces sp. 8L]MCA1224048.1 VOC family protein [Streptomyces sp. 8L]
MHLPSALNHIAFQTDRLEETHYFYTKIMGLRFAGAVRRAPGQRTSDGSMMPDFLHTFYEMPSGECIAFFDVENTPRRENDGWPLWTRHLALSLDSIEAVDEYAVRLREHAIKVRGPINHDGVWYSIYFFDPSGVHLELTHQSCTLGQEQAQDAERLYSAWIHDRHSGRVTENEIVES